MSFSTSSGLARPVRILANSCLACTTAFFMASAISSRTRSAISLTTTRFSWLRSNGSYCHGAPRRLIPSARWLSDQRTDGAALDDGTDVALTHQIEHHDRE